MGAEFSRFRWGKGFLRGVLFGGAFFREKGGPFGCPARAAGGRGSSSFPFCLTRTLAAPEPSRSAPSCPPSGRPSARPPGNAPGRSEGGHKAAPFCLRQKLSRTGARRSGGLRPSGGGRTRKMHGAGPRHSYRGRPHRRCPPGAQRFRRRLCPALPTAEPGRGHKLGGCWIVPGALGSSVGECDGAALYYPGCASDSGGSLEGLRAATGQETGAGNVFATMGLILNAHHLQTPSSCSFIGAQP